jgi:hypothetical protein
MLQQRKEPNLVRGTFKNATKPFERMYLDIWDQSNNPSKPGGFRYALVLVDSFTRFAFVEPMQTKFAHDVTKGYNKLVRTMGATPQLIFVDTEGATTKVDRNAAKDKLTLKRAGVGDAAQVSAFETALATEGTVMKRKVGRNDLGLVDAFINILAKAVARARIERNLPQTSWAKLMMEALPALNERPMKTLDGSSPHEVILSIESDKPEDKVLEFKTLKANAKGLEKNEKEHASIVKRLEDSGAFRAPLKIARQFKGVQKVQDPKWEGTVRELKDWKVDSGMAVDKKTGKAYPAKIVQAVPIEAREPAGTEGTTRPKPAYKIAAHRTVFQRFVAPSKAYLQREGRATFASVAKHLLSLDPTWAEMPEKSSTKDGGTMRVFFESFPETFEIVPGAGSTLYVQLKGAPASASGSGKQAPLTRRRLVGKQAPGGTRGAKSAAATNIRMAAPKSTLKRGGFARRVK